MSGFVFNNLIFTKTKEAIVIRRNDRQELPHVALFFVTASGQIDGHLKYELAPPASNPYTPLFRFPAEELTKFESTFSPLVEREFKNAYSKMKKATPAWLRRHGYVLAVSDRDAFNSRLLECAPKSRGKYRVDLEKMKSVLLEDQSHVTLADPAALHSDELRNHRDPVFAVRRGGKDRLLGLVYAPSRYGKRVWFISNSLTTEMPRILVNAVPPDVRQKARDVWYKVYDALELAELGIARD